MADALSSFAVFFVTGVIGASLYLMLQLLVDGNLSVLSNKVIPKIGTMGTLYVLAGGVFAAVVQESTGNLFQLTNLQTVFFLGFGWQGALSGVGAARQASIAADRGATEAKALSDRNYTTLLGAKDLQIENMKDTMNNYSKSQ